MTNTPSSSKGQYLYGPSTLRLEERKLPAPEADEIQIRIRSTTICGSDVHYFKYGRNGSIEVKEPLCGGHEAAGEVIALGSSVVGNNKRFKIGDKVAIESGVPCGDCVKCKKGTYNVCSQLRFRSSGASFPHFQGTSKNTSIIQRNGATSKAFLLYPLPNTLSFDDGALLEPLSVCIHAVRKAKMEQQSTCIVFGAGAVGMLCAAVAKIEHHNLVVIADIDPGRVEFAVKQGFADVGFTVVPKQGSTLEERLVIAKDVASEIGRLRWPGGRGHIGRLDTVFECTGVESCVQASIYAADNGGRVVLVGMGTAIQTWPIAELTGREVDIIAVWRYANCYPRAIGIMDAVASGTVSPDLRKLITHRFAGLDSILNAYHTAAKTRDDQSNLIIKAVVNL